MWIQKEVRHPKLNNEAAKVIGTLPKMKPGMKDGKPINVK
jgi:hypothetical protein